MASGGMDASEFGPHWNTSLDEMYNVMLALRDCLAVKFDCSNNLLSFVHTILVNILQYVRLYIKEKYYYYVIFLPLY